MTIYRTIETSFTGADKHWVGDGFYVSQYFPERTLLLCTRRRSTTWGRSASSSWI